MSRYFVQPEKDTGPGGDIVFRRWGGDVGYTLYVGDKLFGVVSLVSGAWTGISYADKPSKYFRVRMMDGFHTRFHAAQFIIRHHGYWIEKELDGEVI